MERTHWRYRSASWGSTQYCPVEEEITEPMSVVSKLKVTKYGLVWNPVKDNRGNLVPAPDWYIERNMCVRYDKFRDENPDLKMMPWWEHFARLVHCIFGDPKGVYYFQWNPNAARVIKQFKDKKILSLAGHKSCVHGDTKLVNPINGTSPTIRELCERGEAPIVMTLAGPVQAEVPYIKGTDLLYEVTLSNGGKFTCTLDHRVLTPSGYVNVSAISCGELLLGYGPSHQVSLVRVQSIRNVGTHNFYDLHVPVQEHYFAEGGIHHNSGKTDVIAMIGVMMFWLDPENTKVIVTSTTISAAQQKVWGKVKLIWQHLAKFFGGEENLPGRLMDSKNTIRYEDKGVKHELRGLTLVAGDKGSARESADKLQGTKAPVFIVVGDEFDTLEHSLVNTIFGNLSANDQLYLLAGFNPTSYYSPGGIISKPFNGWHTVDENSTEWETEIEPFGIRGYCLRFDGEKSPNVIAGVEKWKGLLTLENINQFGGLGSKTPIYYSQIRGWWSATGNVDSIYSEVEIIQWRADAKVKTWVDKPKFVAGLDPAWTHGGDRAVLTIGKVGLAQSSDTGLVQKVFEVVKFYILDLDMTNTSTSKTEWVVKLTKQKLAEHGVDVRDLAFDGTGGGEPFSALINRDLGAGAMNVNFSSKASDKQVSKNDKRKGRERFRNMVSELWYVGKELIRTGQLKGLQPDIVTEMVARTYEEIGGVVKVESKDDMKLRTKKSPDIADSLFLCLHMARMRHGLSSTETAAKRVVVNKGPVLFPTIDLNAKAPRVMVEALGDGGGWGYGLHR